MGPEISPEGTWDQRYHTSPPHPPPKGYGRRKEPDMGPEIPYPPGYPTPLPPGYPTALPQIPQKDMGPEIPYPSPPNHKSWRYASYWNAFFYCGYFCLMWPTPTVYYHFSWPFVTCVPGLRGAIAFALSLHLEFENEKRHVIVTTTLIIVLFTVLILGGSTMPLLKVR